MRAGLAAAVGLSFTAVAQPHAQIDVKVTSSRSITGAVEYSNPALGMRGTIEAPPGRRLYIVELAIGESDVAAELVTFRLAVDGGGEFTPIAAGGGSNLLFPIDRLPLGREMMQILPTDGIIAVTRHSPTNIILETTPQATLALLYEIPQSAVVESLKLPDGSVLKTKK